MPEHLRALVVVLGISAVVFALARRPATAVAIAPRDFNRRRNAWFAVTLLAFLSNSFWIYIIGAAALLAVLAAMEQNRLAMFFALVFAVPSVSAKIGALGFLEHLFAINHVRLLALVILLPAFLHLVTQRHPVRFGRSWPDRFLVAYLVVSFGVMLATTTFTNVLRHGVFYAFLDIFLPYYVASRALKDLPAIRDALMSFVVACAVLGGIAMFEMIRHWMLYAALIGALDVYWGYGQYLPRGSFALRAQATTGQPIALGFVMAVALGFMLYLRQSVPGAMARRILFGFLVGGLVASISRGPWLGALAMVLVFIGTGRGAGRMLARVGVAAVLVVPIAANLPGLRDLVQLLPFVGSVESENISYRQRLLEVAMDQVWQSPWFGGLDIYAAEGSEGLRQHYGTFIDVVNTYVGILLGSGFVGLSLFLGVFASIGLAIWKKLRNRNGLDEEQRVLGRALLATLIGILAIIFTTSSITIIPTVYWCCAGLGVAFLSVTSHKPDAAPSRTRAFTTALRGGARFGT